MPMRCTRVVIATFDVHNSTITSIEPLVRMNQLVLFKESALLVSIKLQYRDIHWNNCCSDFYCRSRMTKIQKEKKNNKKQKTTKQSKKQKQTVHSNVVLFLKEIHHTQQLIQKQAELFMLICFHFDDLTKDVIFSIMLRCANIIRQNNCPIFSKSGRGTICYF